MRKLFFLLSLIIWQTSFGQLSSAPGITIFQATRISLLQTPDVPFRNFVTSNGFILRTAANANHWNDICWSPELGLFCAVAVTNAGDSASVMTSPDGITWSARKAASNNAWTSICWSKTLGLFCAVANTGTGNRVMTSPDGIVWTSRASSSDYAWGKVLWAKELGIFCALQTGASDSIRTMTSIDGINWVSSTSIAFSFIVWTSAYSPDLSRFVATTAGTHALYSNDGKKWSLSNTIVGLSGSQKPIVWSPELSLFVAMGSSNANSMSSPDGVNWTVHSITNGAYTSISWSRELGLFLGFTSTGAVLTSPDAITWASMAGVNIGANAVNVWSPQLGIYAAVGNAGSVATTAIPIMPQSSSQVGKIAKDTLNANSAIFGTWHAGWIPYAVGVDSISFVQPFTQIPIGID